MSALQNKKILICRPKDKGLDMVNELERQKAQVSLFATSSYELLPIDETIASTMSHIGDYQWIIFASPYGVEAFSHFADALSITMPPTTGLSMGIVGKKSEEAVSKKFSTWAISLQANHLQELIGKIACQFYDKTVRILNPTSKDSLQKIPVQVPAHITLQRLTLYLTKLAEHTEEEIAYILKERWDAIVFGSPSSYDSFVESTGKSLLHQPIPIAVLGSTTQKYIVEQGFAVQIVPERPGINELITALEKHFKLCV